MSFQPTHKIRIVTAASLFDGHDAAINIMRRIFQSKGAEVVHLGHNRSAHEIVEAAIEEDAHGIAVTSYQGGHVEFFKFMKDLLQQAGCGHIKIFGGGGGTILPHEIEILHQYGITRIYSPDDGRKLGLEGMIEDVINRLTSTLSVSENNEEGDYWKAANQWNGQLPLGEKKDIRKIARGITLAETGIKNKTFTTTVASTVGTTNTTPVLGITGTGGAGKSSVTDEIVRRFLSAFQDKTVAVISVDPSKKKTGGALLGDRIRMNAISSPRAYMRSLATRESDKALSAHVEEAVQICRDAAFDFIILESAGVGQSDVSITDYCDVSLYVMTPEYGAASQLEKINMLDYADVIAINKFDKAGALDAHHDVCKQYKRNHGLWKEKDEQLPVVGTIAAQFNDAGIHLLFKKLIAAIEGKTGHTWGAYDEPENATGLEGSIIPAKRTRYLSEIAEEARGYDAWVTEQSTIATKLYQLQGVIDAADSNAPYIDALKGIQKSLEETLHPDCKKLLQQWPHKIAQYKADFFEYQVRNKIIKQPLTTTSLSGTRLPKVVLPKYKDWGDLLRWQLKENIPGEFPFTAGVFPLKKTGRRSYPHVCRRRRTRTHQQTLSLCIAASACHKTFYSFRFGNALWPRPRS